MNHTIILSDSVFHLLDERARQSRLSPDDLAERLLTELLDSDEQAWRAQFNALLARTHERAVAGDPAPADIEADITAAHTEARAERRARRRPA